MSSSTAAILYPGDMGTGLGRLLRKHSVRMVTNLEGRSPRSQQLALTAGFEDLGSDKALLTTADTLISVLVPSASLAIAKRIAACAKTVEHGQLRTESYVDANAVSPRTARQISSFFNDSGITFVDGSIIGGSPRLKHDDSWYRPTIALSRPGIRDINLDDIFDVSYVGPEIGQASALKMSFASLTKVETYAGLSILMPIGIYRHCSSSSGNSPRSWTAPPTDGADRKAQSQCSSSAQ